MAAKLGQSFGYFRDHAAEVYKNQPLEKAGLSLKDYITSITQSVDAFGFKLRVSELMATWKSRVVIGGSFSFSSNCPSSSCVQELENDGVEQETGGTGGGGEEEGTSGGAGGGRKNSGEAEPQVGILGPASDACHSLTIVYGIDGSFHFVPIQM